MFVLDRETLELMPDLVSGEICIAEKALHVDTGAMKKRRARLLYT